MSSNYYGGSYTFDAPERWQCYFQDAATKVMDNIIDLHNDIMFFLVGISVFVFYMLIRIVYAYRIENKRTKRRLTLQHNTLMEIVWTLTPAVILMFIALPSYMLIYLMDEVLEPQMTLNITGHQWYWTYRHPEAKINYDSYMTPPEDLEPIGAFRLLEVDRRVVLPIRLTIRLLVSSADVIHSWAVPSLGIKVDACPGRLNQIGLKINRLGVFYGQCSEICGVNHSFMPIAVESCTTKGYINWIKNFE